MIKRILSKLFPSSVAGSASDKDVIGTKPSTEDSPQPGRGQQAPVKKARAKMGDASKAYLVMARGPNKGKKFSLEGGSNLIGRWDPDTGAFPEIDLEHDDEDAKISRKHAKIVVEPGKVILEDLGSLNGTFINRGPRLEANTPYEIKNGDEVIVGKTFMVLEVE